MCVLILCVLFYERTKCLNSIKYIRNNYCCLVVTGAGLTALRSEDISDLMLQDYPDKYDVSSRGVLGLPFVAEAETNNVS